MAEEVQTTTPVSEAEQTKLQLRLRPLLQSQQESAKNLSVQFHTVKSMF
jgi:hypothetical protein